MLNFSKNRPYVLSIITIEKDDREGHSATQLSLGEIPGDVQWIVKSYSSEDKKYETIGNVTKITSPDTGIYNAMNEAVGHCRSDWVLFLNAGDCLTTTLQELTDILKMYGGNNTTLIFNWSVYGRIFTANIKKIRYGSAFSHQAAVISADQFQQTKYNEKYELAADYDFFLKSWRGSTRFIQVPLTLSKIQPGGVSDTRRIQVYREFHAIQNCANLSRSINYTIFLKNTIINVLKKPFKKLFEI
jgi:hypothetical protein